MRSGANLQTLQALVEECDTLQVDLEQESKQIRSIVSEATNWIETFVDILGALHIPITSIIPPLPQENQEEQVNQQENLVGYGDLKNLIDSAHHLNVQFPELM